MGTQIQSETYFLRHCSRNLSRNISTGRWLSYQDGKVPENIQHENLFSPWQGLMDKYSGTNKAKARDTILEHEVTFRYQVRELHRLYRRQRELMNEIQDNRLYKLQKRTDLSQPVISPSHTSLGTENAKKTWDGSHFLSSGRLDFLSSRSGQSPSTVLKRKGCESFNPSGGMYLWKPVDLNISRGPLMNKEETIVEGKSSFALVGNGVGCIDRTKEPIQERASNSFFNNAVKYHISAGNSESNVRSKGRNYLGNLNEPFQFRTGSSSGKSSCRLSCHVDDLEQRNLTDNVSSGFFLSKEKSQNSMPAMNGRIFLNRSPPDFDGYGKELKSHGFKFSTDLSLHVEQKTESRKKRKIFGVEIAEEVDESTLLSSDANDSYPTSDGGERDTSAFLFGRAFAGSLSKNASSPQGSHGATTPELSWLKLGSCLQNLEFVGDMDARDALKTSVSKSDLFHQSSLCVHPQLNSGLRDGGAASLDISMGKNVFTSLPELFEFQDSNHCWKSVNSTELERKFVKSDSEITNMSDSVSQRIFKITKRNHIPSKKSNLGIATTKDAEDKKDDHVIEKRVGFPSTKGISKGDVMDPLTDAVSKKGRTQLSVNLNVPDNSFGNFISGLSNQIDMNLSIDEAEAPTTAIHPSTVVKIIGPEIDFEVPALIVSGLEDRVTKSVDKSEEPHQYSIKEAAQALVVISSVLSNDVAKYDTCHLENTFNFNLLADVICSYTSDEDGVVRDISQTIDGCDDEAGPKGMDYFEFMTLQLKDVKEESYCYSLPDTEQRRDEETKISAPKRRSATGNGKRGRQQKDFQKVLPDLVSLVKQEVVEDLHTLEEQFFSTGNTWKSSHSPRINAKKGRQGMKSGKSLHKPEAKPARLPSKHKQTGGELQIRGKGFTGWGKRTRRLPRQRCWKKPCSSIQL